VLQDGSDTRAFVEDVGPLLAEAILFTESTVEPLLEMSEKEVLALSFPVRWGPTYDRR
jgi:hypothetical protein